MGVCSQYGKNIGCNVGLSFSDLAEAALGIHKEIISIQYLEMKVWRENCVNKSGQYGLENH